MIEASSKNIPSMDSGVELGLIFDKYLDNSNAKQLSNFNDVQAVHMAILEAYSMANDEYDIDGFLFGLVNNLFVLSGSIEGLRAQQLQNIAVGVMSKQFQLELAQIRAGEENSKLKDII